MPTPAEAIDVSLIWVEEGSVLDTNGFALPIATIYQSLAEALERAGSPAPGSGARPWLQVDGILFGPAQIDVLRRLICPSKSTT